MGASKTKDLSEEQNQIAAMAKAVEQPPRLAIIEYLLFVDSLICGDTINILPLVQTTVSHLFKGVKNAGIFKGNMEGTAICYCLDQTTITILKLFFVHLAVNINNKKTNCC
jgi:hypothetical protein